MTPGDLEKIGVSGGVLGGPSGLGIGAESTSPQTILFVGLDYCWEDGLYEELDSRGINVELGFTLLLSASLSTLSMRHLHVR